MKARGARLVTILVSVVAAVAAPGRALSQEPPVPVAAPKAGVEKAVYGTTKEGAVIDVYTLTNRRGMIARVITYGAILTELHVPDRDGRMADVVLGFKTIEGYEGAHPYFGGTIGRVANRIAKGTFTLAGTNYTLAANNGPNHLHGGVKGFDRRIWRAQSLPSQDGPTVRLGYVSPDGEEGYPGTVTVSVTYTLTDRNELRLDYTASTDKPTPINLTNHSYFNLGGDGSGDILGHDLTIMADRFTPVDETLIPTGELTPVKDTVMDFTRATPIGARIEQVPGAPPGGYDHNYVLNHGGGVLAQAAILQDPFSGRRMEVLTTEPGIQLYTGNFLDGTITGKAGVPYKKHAALCLETQHFPDSVNRPNFPPTILQPDKTFKSTTVYRFSAR